MKKRSKKYVAAKSKIDATKIYKLDEAIALIKEVAFAKFDETIDLSFRLGVDPRHADQMVRGAISLPAGTGNTVRVCVIASGEKVNEALKAGADFAGGDEIIAKIAGGWMDFDRMIATPDMMGKIGRIGRLLGPRGLMPNPKIGTVTFDVAKTVTELKKGRAEFRAEKAGIVQCPIGKVSFGPEKLKENFQTLMDALLRAKPSGAKGAYILSLYVSSSMGPSVKIDHSEFLEK